MPLSLVSQYGRKSGRTAARDGQRRCGVENYHEMVVSWAWAFQYGAKTGHAGVLMAREEGRPRDIELKSNATVMGGICISYLHARSFEVKRTVGLREYAGIKSRRESENRSIRVRLRPLWCAT